MIRYKLTHPADLISRMFIVEYMNELNKDLMYTRANKHEKRLMFYKYSTDEEGEGFEGVDLNWSFIMFEATLHQLEKFMKNFLQEIAEIEGARQKEYKKAAEDKFAESASKPVSINLMDLAQTEINKLKDAK